VKKIRLPPRRNNSGECDDDVAPDAMAGMTLACADGLVVGPAAEAASGNLNKLPEQDMLINANATTNRVAKLATFDMIYSFLRRGWFAGVCAISHEIANKFYLHDRGRQGNRTCAAAPSPGTPGEGRGEGDLEFQRRWCSKSPSS